MPYVVVLTIGPRPKNLIYLLVRATSVCLSVADLAYRSRSPDGSWRALVTAALMLCLIKTSFELVPQSSCYTVGKAAERVGVFFPWDGDAN